MLGIKSKPKNNSSKTSNAISSNNAQSDGVTSVVAAATKISGNFNCKENARFDGEIIGNIICEARIVIGEQASVEGNINTNNAIISGKVYGNIEAVDTIYLTKTANVTGKLISKHLVVDEGARHNGQCEIGLSA